MKKLSDFKKQKIDLKSINGGKHQYDIGVTSRIIWHAPGGADTPGNTIHGFSLDMETVTIYP